MYPTHPNKEVQALAKRFSVRLQKMLDSMRIYSSSDSPMYPWARRLAARHRMLDLMRIPLDGKTYFRTTDEFMALNPDYNFFDARWTSSALQDKELSIQEIKEQSEIEQIRMLLVHAYYQAGEKKFYVYSDLARMLLDTDIPLDATGNDVRLPFEAVCICVKPGTLPHSLAAHTYIYIYESPSTPTLEESWGQVHLRVSSAFPRLDEEQKNEVVKRRCLGNEGDYYRLKNGLLPPRLLWAMLASDTDTSLPLVHWGLRPETIVRNVFRGSTFTDRGDVSEERNEDFARAETLLVNLLLYINSAGADIQRDDSTEKETLAALKASKPGTRQNKQLIQDLKKARSGYIYLIGKNIKADEIYQNEEKLAEDAERRKLLIRFRVRGHWRNQACGPELSERKKMWIQPYWKGPTFAELINKQYVVKTEGTQDKKEGEDDQKGT